MSVRRFRRWSEAETAKARELVDTDIHPDAFLAQVGRTKDAARSRLKWIDNPAYRAAHSADMCARRREMPHSHIIAAPKFAPPPDVVADAMRRAVAPRSLTALLMGDPAPGASALDRRAVPA